MLRMGRRIGIAIAGGFVMLVGLVLSVPLVPGPGVAVMVLGLAILSLEFERPRQWLEHLHDRWLQWKARFLVWWAPRRQRYFPWWRSGR